MAVFKKKNDSRCHYETQREKNIKEKKSKSTLPCHVGGADSCVARQEG
jgi:hypothetical protein